METMAAAKGWMTREAEAAFVELMNVGNQRIEMLHETVEEAVAQLRQDMAASSAAARSGIDRAVSQCRAKLKILLVLICLQCLKVMFV